MIEHMRLQWLENMITVI